jgi:hypothetical protein
MDDFALVVHFINTITYYDDIFACVCYPWHIFSKEEDSMPRKSPFPIVLSEAERAELEKMTRRYASPYYSVIRAKAILMAAQDRENDEIGQKLGLPRQIVSKWRKRFHDERLEGLEDRSRPGRPSGFPPGRRRSGKGPRV